MNPNDGDAAHEAADEMRELIGELGAVLHGRRANPAEAGEIVGRVVAYCARRTAGLAIEPLQAALLALVDAAERAEVTRPEVPPAAEPDDDDPVVGAVREAAEAVEGRPELPAPRRPAE
jgi:hypothetical protein